MTVVQRSLNSSRVFFTKLQERPNQFVLYELWKGKRAEFDATQGKKPYRKAYIENTKKFLEKVDVEWNSPILEWGTNLTALNQS